MKKLLVTLALLGAVLSAVAQDKINQYDAKKQKQGPWSENMPELRGEPGYIWEGVYKSGRKEGVWIKYSTGGTKLAEETYKNNVLNGPAKYYFNNGKLMSSGSFVATDIDGQVDTIRVIDAATNEEKDVVITRQGNPVMHGAWRVFDEETNKYITQYYQMGEMAEAPADTSQQQKAAPAKSSALPHEMKSGAPKKKKQ
ncbi:hypothetical protein MKQ70_06070 [Chitinophaga sedimenti]|uniref:toxin-antitoxin system YwqK family antitoxin n=1 Tax=Chitinophaga sedimenti TaxID=2033606 RepID=UPI0020063022|nr:hypothetical protein [Chitinophaga sedimenti]MCK7554594.1 hypothetical protein [Chitinophaga sedimenti]